MRKDKSFLNNNHSLSDRARISSNERKIKSITFIAYISLVFAVLNYIGTGKRSKRWELKKRF